VTHTDDYSSRYGSVLVPIAKRLEILASGHLAGSPNIDRITSRAKSPDRFGEKAARVDSEGRKKYVAPLEEIQDQIGIRVVVFYLADVDVALNVLTEYFARIEEARLVPESHWEFGYFGRHAVMALPGDAVPKEVRMEDAPRFFELQVKTLFQHAWSEAEHDLNYKASSPLTGDQQRRLAFAAAQAWGADRAFEELRAEAERAE
jgi:ppGpp synthetase/RelA/SpoT-type nucleotidyltranferase